jgi:hypothetical protein
MVIDLMGNLKFAVGCCLSPLRVGNNIFLNGIRASHVTCSIQIN